MDHEMNEAAGMKMSDSPEHKREMKAMKAKMKSGKKLSPAEHKRMSRMQRIKKYEKANPGRQV